MEESVRVKLGDMDLEGILSVPEKALGLVVFAYGSDSERVSPGNNLVAKILELNGFATFLVNLITKEEEVLDIIKKFDIALVSRRLNLITLSLLAYPEVQLLPIGFFGAGTGAAPAIIASCYLSNSVKALVCRGGRLDLASEYLSRLQVPTLLVVGENDPQVLALNLEAVEKLNGEKKLEVVKGATHLFEEEGALEQVARLAGDWFLKFLAEEPQPGIKQIV
jgi:putative phosphoribosyl transferase